MDKQQEQHGNVVNYLFEIIPTATNGFTRKPTEAEWQYIYQAAQNIYVQCIAKEIKRWEAWKAKEEQKNEKND
jgi:hypothetical protein